MPPRHAAIYGAPGPPIIGPVGEFRAGSAKLEPRLFADLDIVVDVLRHEPDWRLAVEGHADSTERHALELSERRARAVRDYLVSKGIVPDRLEVEGLADRKPLTGSKTESDRRRNRRVTLHRIDAEAGAD